MSFFTHVPQLPDDPILSLAVAFTREKNPNKVNLGIGAYKNHDGLPVVLNCVKEAEQILLDKGLNKDYLPIEGNMAFTSSLRKIIFGVELENSLSEHLLDFQTIGGTGALRIGSEFLMRSLATSFSVSHPTWSNHHLIFSYTGAQVDSYPFYVEGGQLDFAGMYQKISSLPQGTVVLLHACCHNPTGIRLIETQWQELLPIFKKHRLIPFFDVAYHGLGQNLDADVYAIRLFAEARQELFVAYSCSKNFGLYGERVGMLTIHSPDKEVLPRINSQLKQIIRGNYSMPPLQGGRIVATILQSDHLRQMWIRELDGMRSRILEMRLALFNSLKAKGIILDDAYLTQQEGLFSMIGLTADQVQLLKQKYGIYLPSNGRINIAGLNHNNLDYVTTALVKTKVGT